jgi:hypothetical protein
VQTHPGAGHPDVTRMPDGSVRAQLLARDDDISGRMAELLEEVRTVTEQLHPERARSCRNAITMASVMVDEIRLPAHARPLGEGGSLDSDT